MEDWNHFRAWLIASGAGIYSLFPLLFNGAGERNGMIVKELILIYLGGLQKRLSNSAIASYGQSWYIDLSRPELHSKSSQLTKHAI
jgi:hypothetical protein